VKEIRISCYPRWISVEKWTCKTWQWCNSQNYLIT